MKKIIIMIISVLFISILPAVEAVLIDFNNLDKTTIDFSKLSEGKGYDQEIIKEMNVSLEPHRWLIKVNSSSFTNEAREKTYLLPIKNSQHFPEQMVLGVRVFFPQRHANSFATITPPFEIPSYYDDAENITGLGDKYINKGVVRNVAILRKLSVLSLGNNFRYSLYVRIKDNRGVEKDIYIGMYDYEGWKTKSWINPNIEIELKLREQRKSTTPRYPDEYPGIKLMGFIIQRSDPEITGNFVTMIKEVRVEYDEAVISTGKTEDYQEAIFGIYTEELVERAKHEMWNVDRRIYLEWEENKKMHFDPNARKRVAGKVPAPATATPDKTAPKTN